MHDSDLTPIPPKEMLLFLWRHMKPYKWAVFAFAFMDVVSGMLMMLTPYAMKQMLDGVALAAEQGLNDYALFLMPLLFMVGLRAGVEAMILSSSYIRSLHMPRIRLAMRDSLFDYVLRHSNGFFQNNFAGKLGSRVSQGALAGVRLMRSIFTKFMPVFSALITAFVILFTVNSVYAIAFGVWAIVYIVVVGYFVSKARLTSQVMADRFSSSNGRIIDVITNFMNVKLFARLDVEEAQMQPYNESERKALVHHWVYLIKVGVLQAGMSLILLAGVVVGAVYGWQEGFVSIGDVALLVATGYWVLEYMFQLSSQFVEFFEEWGTFTEGLSVLGVEHEIVDKPNAQVLKVAKGELKFDAVNFAYGEMAIFKDMDVTIKPGEKVGLVGYSGSGKSTFVNLSLRMFDPQSGSVKIDDQNIAEITQDSLRQNVAMIPQEPVLFHRSLMDNIRYGKSDATDEEVKEAADKAYATDFIQNTDEGYETLVGERGIKLSGGQRQRIAIARAFLKNAPILLLDEATSALDSQTEHYIQQSLDELMKGRTVLVVAHRLSTIAHLDRILVFDNGQIIEDGSHEELLKTKGHYAKLWNMQAGGFLPEKE